MKLQETVNGRLAGHSRPDTWDINISFNLSGLQSGRLSDNAKKKRLDITLNDLAV